MSTGAHALALRGRASEAAERPLSLAAPAAPGAPERANVLLLLVARLLTTLAVGVLALLSSDADVPLVAALYAVGLVEVVATTATIVRRSHCARSALLRPALVLDIGLWLAICAASGGDESPVLLLAAVLPTVGALVLDARGLVVCGLLLAAGRLVLGGPTDLLVSACLVLVWVVALAISGSRSRHVFSHHIRQLDEVWTAMSGGSASSGFIRERVADDLRVRALQPVLAVRAACATGIGPEDLDDLNSRMSTIVARTRAIAHELHAPAALHGGVAESVRHVAQLRAPAAEVVVRVQGYVPDELADPLDAVVRDALGIVAGTWTREVVVDVRADGGAASLALAVTVTATPLLDFDGERRALRRSALAARAEVEDVDVSPTPDGGGCVRSRLRSVVPLGPAGTPQARSFRQLGGYVSVIRFGIVPLVGAIALLTGGTDPGFWWVYGVFALHFMALGAFMPRRARSRRLYAAVGVLDAVLLAAGFALAGDAQVPFAAIALMAPIMNAPIYPWPTIVAVTVLAAATVALTAEALPQPAISVAVLWAGTVALVEFVARVREEERFFAVARRRNELLRALLEEEEEERRRIAGQLHDDVLQRLFVVRQDLEEAAEESGLSDVARDQALAGLDGIVAVLTRTVGDLDVDEGAVVVAGGLRAALETTTALRDGPNVDLTIDDAAAGLNDGLVVQLVRELYTKESSLAGAEHLRINVLRQPGGLVLDVVGDGEGLDWERLHDGTHEGRIGLSTVRARTERLGGSILLGDAPGGGAHVQIRLPMASADPGSVPASGGR